MHDCWVKVGEEELGRYGGGPDVVFAIAEAVIRVAEDSFRDSPRSAVNDVRGPVAYSILSDDTPTKC